MGKLRGAVAHDITQSARTVDVLLSENTTFSDMLLSERTLQGLHSAGFIRPSPIQRCAIPIGRCGTDLIVQAKSGTGKTLVFGIIALEMLDLSIPRLQVLIMTPTREIAVQIKEVLSSVSLGFSGLQIAAFIGGLSVKGDLEAAECCHVAVGTPGRIKQLVREDKLRLRSVRLFVLDEADRLVDSSFKKDVNEIFSYLPETKQTVVVSATFPTEMEQFLSSYLVHPRRVSPSADTLLVGLRQFVAVTPAHTSSLVRVRNKTAVLLEILSSLSFRQCLVFCNIQSRTESISKDLARKGWPALHLSGSMPQDERLSVVAALQNQRCRVLLTTDLASRGVDAEQVDLVVNLDIPFDTETYLHRIGRAGRFGGAGIAVTIVEEGVELSALRYIFFDIGGPTFQVPLLPEKDLIPSIWKNGTILKFVESLERPKNPKKKESKSAATRLSSSCANKIIDPYEGCRKKPMNEADAIEILKSHMISTPEEVPFISFDKLNELYYSKDLNAFRSEFSRMSQNKASDVNKLEAAMKTLGIADLFSDSCCESTRASVMSLSQDIPSEDESGNESLQEHFNCFQTENIPKIGAIAEIYESEGDITESDQSDQDNIESDQSDQDNIESDQSDQDNIESDQSDQHNIESDQSDEDITDSDQSEEFSEHSEVVMSEPESGLSLGDEFKTDLEESDSNEVACDRRTVRGNCEICRSWFIQWRQELIEKREELQNRIYLQEMLKH